MERGFYSLQFSDSAVAVDLGDVSQQTHHVGGEAVLVVVPGNELHEVAVQSDKVLEIQIFSVLHSHFSVCFKA